MTTGIITASQLMLFMHHKTLSLANADLFRVKTPGYIPKKPSGFFWVHPPKKNPYFYFNLILVYTLYATNNALFYCFKAFKALGYWVLVLLYLFFPAFPKKPKNPVGWAFFLKNGFFLNPGFVTGIVLCVGMLQGNEAIFQACLSQLTPAAQAALSSVLSTWTTFSVFECWHWLPSSPIAAVFLCRFHP